MRGSIWPIMALGALDALRRCRPVGWCSLGNDVLEVW